MHACNCGCKAEGAMSRSVAYKLSKRKSANACKYICTVSQTADGSLQKLIDLRELNICSISYNFSET